MSRSQPWNFGDNSTTPLWTRKTGPFFATWEERSRPARCRFIMATKGVKPLERALENAIESGNETMAEEMLVMVGLA